VVKPLRIKQVRTCTEISIQYLFENPSVSGVAQVIDEHIQQGSWSNYMTMLSTILMKEDYYPMNNAIPASPDNGIERFLAQLFEKGAALWVQDNELHFKMVKRALTLALKEELNAYKEALVHWLGTKKYATPSYMQLISRKAYFVATYDAPHTTTEKSASR
jgi:hypothetical protein